MTTQSRKHRGMRTQKLVAEYLAQHGWPFAESTGAARQGADVTGTPDIAVEVKARTNFEPLSWARQTARNSDGRFGFAVLRCNGQGEQTIEEWPALVPFGQLVQLLREAGYGDAKVDAALTRAAIGRLESTRPRRHDHPLSPTKDFIDGHQVCGTCGQPHRP